MNAFEQLSVWNGTIALGDFNGDGNLDIAVASGRNQSTQYGIVEGDGTGNFGPLALYQGYTNNADGYDDNYQRAIDYLAVSDFNKDGQPDIVTTALNIGTVGPRCIIRIMRRSASPGSRTTRPSPCPGRARSTRRSPSWVSPIPCN